MAKLRFHWSNIAMDWVVFPSRPFSHRNKCRLSAFTFLHLPRSLSCFHVGFRETLFNSGSLGGCTHTYTPDPRPQRGRNAFLQIYCVLLFSHCTGELHLGFSGLGCGYAGRQCFTLSKLPPRLVCQCNDTVVVDKKCQRARRKLNPTFQR